MTAYSWSCVIRNPTIRKRKEPSQWKQRIRDFYKHRKIDCFWNRITQYRIVSMPRACWRKIVYSISRFVKLHRVFKLAFLNRSLCSLHDFLTFIQRENFCCTGDATTSIDRGKTCWQAAVHPPSCLPLGRRGCLLWWCIIESREHNIAWPCYSFPSIPKAGAIQTANRLPT